MLATAVGVCCWAVSSALVFDAMFVTRSNDIVAVGIAREVIFFNLMCSVNRAAYILMNYLPALKGSEPLQTPWLDCGTSGGVHDTEPNC